MASKRYRVSVDADETVLVAGHKAGEEFEFDFSEGYNEAALLAGGVLELVSDGKKRRAPSDDEGLHKEG